MSGGGKLGNLHLNDRPQIHTFNKQGNRPQCGNDLQWKHNIQIRTYNQKNIPQLKIVFLKEEIYWELTKNLLQRIACLYTRATLGVVHGLFDFSPIYDLANDF